MTFADLEVPRPTEKNPAPAWMFDSEYDIYRHNWRRRFPPKNWPCCGHTTEPRQMGTRKDPYYVIEHEPDCRVGNDFDLTTLIYWFVMCGVIVGLPDHDLL